MGISRNFYICLLLLLLMGGSSTLYAQVMVGETEVDTHSVVTGLDTPWEIIWGPDDHIWFTERYGRVSRLDPETGGRQTLLVIDQVYEEGESGLLGMVLHPDFQENPYVYLVYNYLAGSRIRERLVRYTYQNETLSSPEILLDGIIGNSNHNGARLVIDSLNRLYFTTGDAGLGSRSQDLNSLSGKILRMNLDGTIPDDNPFQDSYVYTWGHRNPQGLVISSEGIMYSSEHGPASDDEMNIIEKGRNYGWPNVKGYCDEATEATFCEEHNVKEPIAAWTPTLAVAGTDYYEHQAIGEWENSLLMATLKESELVQLRLSEDGREVAEQQVWFDEWFGRLRDVCVSPEGRVYLAVSNRDGRGDPAPGDDRILEIKAAEAITSSPGTGRMENFTVFPNPAKERIQVTLPAGMVGGTLSLYEPNGRLILKKKVARTTEVLEEEGLTTGIYLLVYDYKNQRISRKLIFK